MNEHVSKSCPPPGSAFARARGCLCPILVNAHGRGYGRMPDADVKDGICPLHGLESSAGGPASAVRYPDDDSVRAPEEEP
jgi:hypothetical protein